MKALFPGSFDPFTIGHQSIVERTLRIFGSVVIAIGYNEHKHGEWSVKERLDAISSLYVANSNVSVMVYSGLTSQFAKEIGADILIRGVRTIQDFEYEKSLADINRKVFGIDTLLFISDPEYSFISSSMIRELIHNGYDATQYIAGDFPIKIKG